MGSLRGSAALHVTEYSNDIASNEIPENDFMTTSCKKLFQMTETCKVSTTYAGLVDQLPSQELRSDQFGLGKDRSQPVPFCFDIFSTTLFTVNQGNNAEYREAFLFSPSNRFHG
jgi:hypothetical protein